MKRHLSNDLPFYACLAGTLIASVAVFLGYRYDSKLTIGIANWNAGWFSCAAAWRAWALVGGVE